jgi:hypothetical protein
MSKGSLRDGELRGIRSVQAIDAVDAQYALLQKRLFASCTAVSAVS